MAKKIKLSDVINMTPEEKQEATKQLDKTIKEHLVKHVGTDKVKIKTYSIGEKEIKDNLTGKVIGKKKYVEYDFTFSGNTHTYHFESKEVIKLVELYLKIK